MLGLMWFLARGPGRLGTVNGCCRWLAVVAPRELRPSLSGWRAPPDVPRGFLNAGRGPPRVWQQPARLSSASIDPVGDAAYVEMFYSKELAAF